MAFPIIPAIGVAAQLYSMWAAHEKDNDEQDKFKAALPYRQAIAKHGWRLNVPPPQKAEQAPWGGKGTMQAVTSGAGYLADNGDKIKNIYEELMKAKGDNTTPNMSGQLPSFFNDNADKVPDYQDPYVVA